MVYKRNFAGNAKTTRLISIVSKPIKIAIVVIVIVVVVFVQIH